MMRSSLLTSRRRDRHLVAVVALCVAVLAAGCTLGTPEISGGRRGGDINDGVVALIGVPQRDAAPAVEGDTTDGGHLALADFAGTPTVVNFWASWCGPCAREVPELVAVADAYGDDIAVLGVNVRDSVDNARSFERDQGVRYPSLVDRDATIAAAFGGIAPEALPSTILLDAQQRVAARLFGAVTRDQLEPYLDGLLAEAA